MSHQHHGDVVGLPPTIIFVSGSEVLLDDSIKFSQSLSDHGVAVELSVAENMPHIWPVILLGKEQTLDARRNIAEFNRVGEKFDCLACGYKQDADIVGATNILHNGINWLRSLESLNKKSNICLHYY